MPRTFSITLVIAALLVGCGSDNPGGSPGSTTPSLTGTPVSSWEGKLVKSADDTKIYFIQHGQKCWIKSPEVMQRHGFRWDSVNRVTSAELATVPEGPPVSY